MKPRDILILALSIATVALAILWYQGRQKIKKARFEAASQMAEDTAAVLRPKIDSAYAIADAAEAEKKLAVAEKDAAVARADSIQRARIRIVERIIHDTVPEDARRYTEPRDAVIRSQQEEIGELRSAVAVGDTALAAAGVVIANQDTAIAHLERSLALALDALDLRPTKRWYIPTIGIGYSATVSRRELLDGKVEIRDGPSISAVWEIGL